MVLLFNPLANQPSLLETEISLFGYYDVVENSKADNGLALAYAGYGRLHKQQGQIAQAREYLTKPLEIFDRLGTLIEPDKVRRELAKLPKED